MKKKTRIIFLFCLLFATQFVFGQRFLTDISSQVDSAVDILYGRAVNFKGIEENLYLDFYEPYQDKLNKRPLLIYVHGGGFTEGTRKWPSIKLMCQKLAQRGYAVASIDYRLNPKFNFFKSDTSKKALTDAMHDLRAAVRYFKANGSKYKVDTSMIFISGESAGAVTSMLVGYVDKQEELSAYPKTSPYNIEGNSGTPGYSSKVKAVLCLCGMIMDTSAIESPKGPPLLWVHGSADPLLPFSWASNIPARAENMGLSYQKVVFKGATHCPWYYGLPRWQIYLDSTVNYMSHFMYPLITGKEAPKLDTALAPLQVAGILQNNMVIQQDKPFRIWGFSAPGDTIQIFADWMDKRVVVYAAQNGEWSGSIKVPKAIPGKFDPQTMRVVHRQDTIQFTNILIGEVWICAGQSNMDMQVQEVKGWYGGVVDYKNEIANARYPAIRVFTESVNFSVQKQADVKGKWEICSPQTAGRFSAVAYFFGRKLFQEMNIPVGLVVVAAAGASCQAFVEKEVLMSDTLLKRLYWDPYQAYVRSQSKVDSLDFFTKVTRPSLIYNGMIHPLKYLSICGFTWYQGESNYTEGNNYTKLCSTMIKNWRLDFNQGDLPFYFTQIAPYSSNSNKCDHILGLFWEAQEGLLKVTNTGMALSMDVGELKNIHPKDKKPVGERLGRLALHQTYHYKAILDRGPLFSKYKIQKDGTVKISYASGTTGAGLTTKDGESPKHFSLAGADKIFYPAIAKILGKQVWLHAPEVPKPVAVRYGFTNEAITNLENKEGLPAFPFRTDQWDACPEANNK